MWAFLGRRVLHLLVVLLLVSVGAALLLELVPGDPALAIIGESATDEQIAAVHQDLGLDKPVWERYLSWMGGAVQGDLGTSYRTGQPVMGEILERLPVSIELAVLASAVAVALAVGLGVAAAHHEGRWIDRFVTAVSSATLSTPSFLLALLLVFVLAVQFPIFPVTGWVAFTDDPVENLRRAFLPVTALALAEAAILLRLLRSDMISTLKEDYVFAARAKALPTRQVLFRHALRPSSFSLVTVAGISMGRLIGGTVIVETIFALPGLGSYIKTAVVAKDLVVVQGAVLFIAFAYVCLTAVVELGYAFLDPRTRVRPT